MGPSQKTGSLLDVDSKLRPDLSGVSGKWGRPKEVDNIRESLDKA